MKSGFVVYLDSNPTNVVGLFFTQGFPAGKTAEEAANDFAAALPASFPGTVAPITLDDYTLVSNQDINL